MKQFITERQFLSLSKPNQKKLEQWTIDVGYAIDDELHGYQFDPLDFGKMWYGYPKLSVGQLIEFLDEVDINVHLKAGKQINLGYINGNNKEEELCDALWKTTKEALGEK